MTTSIGLAAAVVALSLMFPAAQTAQVPANPNASTSVEAGPLKAQAERFILVVNEQLAPREVFNATFLAQVPEAQVATIAGQLRSQFGKALRVAAIRAEGPSSGHVDLAFERGTVTVRMIAEPAPPHRVSGLLLTGSQLAGDSIEKLAAEFATLPGRSGLSIARLGEGAPVSVVSHEADRSFAVGSAFKLYVLAELVRAIGAGETRWDRVIPLSQRWLSTGQLHDFPKGSPITLHTLAALMISRSDNGATDMLIAHLGRSKIEAMLAKTGHAKPAANAPFLTTGEAFLLKGNGGRRLLDRWQAGSPSARRALLPELAEIDRARFDYSGIGDTPRAIDTVEWFASPADLVRVLDWFRRQGGEPGNGARAILAINPGIGDASSYDYLGYKGGSETGVINMSLLVRSKAGQWFAVSGSWNNSAAAVNNTRFGALMSRAVALTAR